MNVVVALLIDAVTNKLPVFTVTAEPVFTVIGNVVPSPLVNVIVFELTEAVNTLFNASDAVVANDAETAEPVAIVTGNVEPSPLVNVIIFAVALAVVNNEAVLTVAPPAFKA